MCQPVDLGAGRRIVARISTYAQLVDSSTAAFLRLGDSTDLEVFQQRVEESLKAIPVQTAKLRIVDEAERRVRKIAESASSNSTDRLQVLLDFLDRKRRLVRGELS